MKNISILNFSAAFAVAVVFTTAPAARAAVLASDIEGKIGSNSTYLDLKASDTRNSITLTWTNFSTVANGYASDGASFGTNGDTSDGALLVNGGGADDKDGSLAADPESEISLSITGLMANQQYSLFIIALGGVDGKSDQTLDFEWGETSGSLTTVSPVQSAPGAIQITNVDVAGKGVDKESFAVPVLNFTSSATGTFSLFLNRGTDHTGDVSDNGRTQLDGIAFQVVPEPSVIALLAGGIGMLAMRRRRK